MKKPRPFTKTEHKNFITLTRLHKRLKKKLCNGLSWRLEYGDGKYFFNPTITGFNVKSNKPDEFKINYYRLDLGCDRTILIMRTITLNACLFEHELMEHTCAFTRSNTFNPHRKGNSKEFHEMIGLFMKKMGI